MGQSESRWIRAGRTSCAVVFVHGILSSSEQSWRSGNVYWPQLLSDEASIKDVGIYVFSYRADLFSGNYRLGDAVEALYAYLELDGLLKYRELIFVCHSMGGIVVRQFLVTRQATLIASHAEVTLFLVASPSLGSEYANLLSGLAKIFGNSQAQVLRFAEDNTWLNDLDRNFLNLKQLGHLSIHGQELVEDEFITLPHLFRSQVVKPFSGAKYFENSIKIPHSNHFTVATPTDSSALQHRLLLRLVFKVCEKSRKHSALRSEQGSTSMDHNARPPLASSTEEQPETMLVSHTDSRSPTQIFPPPAADVVADGNANNRSVENQPPTPRTRRGSWALVFIVIGLIVVGTAFVSFVRIQRANRVVPVIASRVLNNVDQHPPSPKSHASEHWTTAEGASPGQFSNEWEVRFDGKPFSCPPSPSFGEALCTAVASGNTRAVQRFKTTDNNQCTFYGNVEGGVVRGTYNCSRNGGPFEWHAIIR